MYRPLFTVQRGLCPGGPLSGGSLSGGLCCPRPVDRQMSVKILPCPKLCLRAVMMMDDYYFGFDHLFGFEVMHDLLVVLLQQIFGFPRTSMTNHYCISSNNSMLVHLETVCISPLHAATWTFIYPVILFSDPVRQVRNRKT